VFAYLDETGTHDSASESVVGAYVFSKDGAKLFRRMFQESISPLLPPDKHGTGIRALINSFYGLTRTQQPVNIRI
jgi:hypothetical protein